MNYYTNKKGNKSIIGYVNCSDKVMSKLNNYAETYRLCWNKQDRRC